MKAATPSGEAVKPLLYVRKPKPRGPGKHKTPPTKAEVAAILATTMPAAEAKKIAGVPKSQSLTAISPGSQQVIQSIRDRLALDPRYSFESSTEFYRRISEANEITEPQTAIKARSRMDKLLGYDSPDRLEIGKKTELQAAIGIFHRGAIDTGMSPDQLIREISAEVVQEELENDERNALEQIADAKAASEDPDPNH